MSRKRCRYYEVIGVDKWCNYYRRDCFFSDDFSPCVVWRFMNVKVMMPWKKMAIISGYLFAMGMALVMFITLYWAYLNGGSTMVRINDYGEAGVELIISFPIIAIMVIGLYYLIRGELK